MTVCATSALTVGFNSNWASFFKTLLEETNIVEPSDSLARKFSSTTLVPKLRDLQRTYNEVKLSKTWQTWQNKAASMLPQRRLSDGQTVWVVRCSVVLVTGTSCDTALPNTAQGVCAEHATTAGWQRTQDCEAGCGYSLQRATPREYRSIEPTPSQDPNNFAQTTED